MRDWCSPGQVGQYEFIEALTRYYQMVGGSCLPWLGRPPARVVAMGDLAAGSRLTMVPCTPLQESRRPLMLLTVRLLRNLGEVDPAVLETIQVGPRSALEMTGAFRGPDSEGCLLGLCLPKAFRSDGAQRHRRHRGGKRPSL